MSKDPLAYFAAPAPMSDLSRFTDRLQELPADLPGLVTALQGLMVHIFWAKAYGLDLDDTRQAEVQIRPAWRKLVRLLELDSAPLNQARPPERRLVGNCRDFTLLLVSFLRARGVPARARCGFGTYFIPGHFEDHWVAEVWQDGCWVQVDAQLDALQRDRLGIQFDPLHLPEGAFLTGGQAWQLCRAGKANPDDFGIFEWKGWSFIAGDLLRDVLALRKFEILPWDHWEGMGPALEEAPAAAWERMDRLAALADHFDDNPAELWQDMEESGWLPPEEWAA